MTKFRTMSFVVPEDQIERLDLVANRRMTSRSQVVREVLSVGLVALERAAGTVFDGTAKSEDEASAAATAAEKVPA